MKIFFINNGNGLSLILGLIFFVMNDLTGDYLPKFSNWYLEMVTYLIIVLLPVSLSIYYKKQKMKKLLLLLLFIPLVSFGQGILKGYTIDFAESPLPGASIYNTTNKKSSISNKVGYFIINASVGDIIKVSYVGFTTQTFKVENFEVLVQLSADKQLEDIVKAKLKNKKSKEKETEIPFALIEDVPLFPGCETVSKSKRRDCFQTK